MELEQVWKFPALLNHFTQRRTGTRIKSVRIYNAQCYTYDPTGLHMVLYIIHYILYVTSYLYLSGL